MKFNSFEDLGKIKNKFEDSSEILDVTGNSSNKKESDNGFEKIKSEFSLWLDGYLIDLFENGDFMGRDEWEDPVSEKINKLVGKDNHITPEMRDLTVVFGEKLIKFCNDLIFEYSYDENATQRFYKNLRSTFFNRTPNIFENLNIDFLKKTIISSQINEVYKLRNVVDISGEMAYDLSYCSKTTMNNLTKDIKKLSEVEKISAVKQLSDTAIDAYSNGAWAISAFEGVVDLIEDVKEEEKSPIISFVLDYELKKIEAHADFADMVETDDTLYPPVLELINNEERMKIENNVSKESHYFFTKNTTSPQLKNVLYSRVSKDYGSIVFSEGLIPMALIRHENIQEEESQKEMIFSQEQIERFEYFAKEIDKDSPRDDQFYADIASFVNYINNVTKYDDFSSFVDKEKLHILEINYKKINETVESINLNKKNITSKIEKENLSKTRELFSYMDNNFDKMFIGNFKQLGVKWLDYKKNAYDEGLFDIVKDIANDNYYFEFSRNSRIKEIDVEMVNLNNAISEDDIENRDLIEDKIKSLSEEKNNLLREIDLKKSSDEGKISDDINGRKIILRNFHHTNFSSLDQKINEANDPLWSLYDEKINEVIDICKNIDLNNVKKIIDRITKEDKNERKILELKSYDNVTKNKELNPLGGDDFSHLVKILHSPEIRNYINNRLNINLENLYLRDQIYFLKFLSKSDENKFSKLEKILKGKENDENTNFLRSFLSMSGDESMGDKILVLGEKLPKEVSIKVFTKYGEIIDNVNKITEFSRSSFTKEIETSPELIQKIEETLYQKGKQLLSETYENINSDKEIYFNDIVKQLDRINADTLTTFAIFKQAVRNGEKMPIESIEGSIFSKKEATSISLSQREEMSELYDRNYKDHPDREFISKVKGYFNTAFIPEANQSQNHFYTFEKDSKIRAFVRFEKQKDSSLYASALNVDEVSKNFGLGEAMMEEALNREAKENILHATCLINNPSNMRYFEKGFISEHFKMVDNTNQLDLVWDESKNIDIVAKQKSIEDLISMYLKKSYEGSIEIKKEDSLEKLHKDIPQGKAIVRCFRNPVKNSEWYAVYESLPAGYGLNTSEVE